MQVQNCKILRYEIFEWPINGPPIFTRSLQSYRFWDDELFESVLKLFWELFYSVCRICQNMYRNREKKFKCKFKDTNQNLLRSINAPSFQISDRSLLSIVLLDSEHSHLHIKFHRLEHKRNVVGCQVSDRVTILLHRTFKRKVGLLSYRLQKRAEVHVCKATREFAHIHLHIHQFRIIPLRIRIQFSKEGEFKLQISGLMTFFSRISLNPP